MKITFVQRQIFALPGISSLLARVLRQGYEADLLIENAEKDFTGKLIETCPDVVGITICSSDVNWFTRTLALIKPAVPKAFILVGGVHPTIHPALLDEHPAIDAICIGEGEEPVVELLDALEASSNSKQLAVSGPDKKQSGSPPREYRGSDKQSALTRGQSPLTAHRSPLTGQSTPLTAHGLPLTSIKNLHLRWKGKIYRNELRPLISNLDDYPENREIYFRRYPQLGEDTLLQYISSRGCPYPCSFCVNEALNRIFRGLGPVHRCKTVNFAIKELKNLRNLYSNAKTIFFIDDLFLFDREWVKDFLPRLKEEIGFPYICSAGPQTIDEEIADLLRDTGCASVEFGIETGNEKKRREVFHKWAFTDEEFRRQIGLVKLRGIDVYAPSMFVFPTEIPSDSFQTVEFYHELGINHPFSSFLMPYPDTKIYEIAVEYGCIPVGFKAEDIPSNYFTHSVCMIPQKRVIENIQYLFYFFVKYPRFYHYFRRLVYLPFPLKPVRYVGLFFWFKNWKRMGYWETIRYFWRFRKAA